MRQPVPIISGEPRLSYFLFVARHQSSVFLLRAFLPARDYRRKATARDWAYSVA